MYLSPQHWLPPPPPPPPVVVLDKPGVEILYGYPVRVEVDGEWGDVPHVRVVNQRAEVHRTTVQEIQNLKKKIPELIILKMIKSA